MSQRHTRQRIREVSRQINDLSLKLDRLLRIEDNNNNIPRQAPARDFSQEPAIGDRVENTNSYFGRFGTTMGSRGRVAEIQENGASIRLEMNGAVVTRGIRNIRVIDREDNARGASQ